MSDYTIEATERTELTQKEFGVLIDQPETEDRVHIAWSQITEVISFLAGAKDGHDGPQQLRKVC